MSLPGKSVRWRVVVTGGYGFIGPNLVKRIEREWPMLKTDGSLTPTSTITRALHWPVGYALGSMGAVSMLENITPL